MCVFLAFSIVLHSLLVSSSNLHNLDFDLVHRVSHLTAPGPGKMRDPGNEVVAIVV